MRSSNDRILDWATRKVRLEYKEDISLLVVYGSYLYGTEDSSSDVDLYFIPRNERAYELGRTFIIGGIGYDLFPMRWERVEGLATLNEPLVSLLGSAEIAYSGSADERGRFETLQGVLRRSLADPVFMHQRAVQKLTQAIDAWSKLVASGDLRDCRLFAGDILLQLADAVAYHNLTYFKKGLKTQFDDLKMMDTLPEGFIQEYEAVIAANTVTDMRETCGELLAACKDFLDSNAEMAVDTPNSDESAQDPQNIDFSALAELYGEIVSTFNRVYYCCEKSGNGVLAFISAVCLQRVLNEEVPYLSLDVLSEYDITDLDRLSARTRSAEAELVRHITSGAAIKRYASVDEFLMTN